MASRLEEFSRSFEDAVTSMKTAKSESERATKDADDAREKLAAAEGVVRSANTALQEELNKSLGLLTTSTPISTVVR